MKHIDPDMMMIQMIVTATITSNKYSNYYSKKNENLQTTKEDVMYVPSW